jgi:predicted Zn-dependent peptidase
VEAPQASLRLGRLAPTGSNNEAVLRALAAVLSRRMGDTLREKKGLAYTLGADASLLADRFQFTASMDVLPTKVDEARLGLRDSLTSLVSAPPAAREVEDAEVSAEVRLLMRNLSRINRAYVRCIEELRRSQAPPRSESTPARTSGGGFEGARGVTADQVAAAARRLLDPQGLADWVEAVVQPTVAQPGP